MIVDKPYVPDQDNNEELFVELIVKGDKVQITSWPDERNDISPREPNNIVGVPAPLQGTIRATVWAINADDDDERREVGQILVPFTSLQKFEDQTCFTVWLGLLDQSMVPSSTYPIQGEAERCFRDSLEKAKDPSTPKVCCTFALIPTSVLYDEESNRDFQEKLTAKPVMQLLGQANDLVKGLTKNNKSLQKELRALHREFRSKETIFHSFVHVEKKQLEKNKERVLETLKKEADRWAKLVNGDMQMEVVFNNWMKVTKDSGLDAMKVKLENVRKGTLDMLNKSFGQNDKEAEVTLLQRTIHEWRVNAHQQKMQEVACLRMFGFNNPHLTLHLTFMGWLHVMAMEEREYPARVCVECDLRGLDHNAFNSDMELAGTVVKELKDMLLMEISKEHGLHARNIRIAMHPDRMPGFLSVEMMISPSTSMTAGKIKMELEKKNVEQEMGAIIQARLVAVPGMSGFTTGALIVDKVTVTYLRGMTEQAHRDRMATHLDKMIEFFISAEKWMLGEIICLAWWTVLDHTRQKAALCDKMLFTAERFLQTEAEEFMSSVIAQWQAHKDIAKLHGWTSVRMAEEKKKWEEFIDEQTTRDGKEINRLQSQVEIEKERAHEHVDCIVNKWIAGDEKGLMMSVFFNWKRFMEIDQELQTMHEQTKLAVMKWIEGEDKGLKTLCFRHWIHYNMLERVHLEHSQKFAEAQADWQNLLTEQNTRHGEEISRHLTAIEIRKEQAHEATQMMLKKWAAGDEKGLKSGCFSEWKRYIDIMRDLERRHEAAKAAVMRFAEGDDRGNKQICLIHWVRYTKQEQEHRKRTDIEVDLEHLGELHKKQLEEQEQRRQAAKAAVELAVRKWECGNVNALRMEVFSLWHKYTQKEVTFRRGQQAVKVQLLKWIEGDQRGLMQAVMGAMREYMKVISETRRMEEQMGKARSEWDQFMAEQSSIHGKELERIQTEAEKRKEQAHEVTEMMLKRWMMGDTKGTLSTMIYEWKRYVEIQRDLVRRHEQAKAAVMGWLEGANRANKQLCMSHWVAFLEVQRIHHENEAKNSDFDQFLREIRDDHGKELERIMSETERRKEQAHEVTQMMLKKWGAGDVKGTLMSIVYEWKRYVEIMKGLERRHEAVKTAVLSFLHDRGVGMMKVCFTHWDAFHEQEKIHRKHNDWKEQMEGFLKEQSTVHGKELDRIMTEKEREKEKAHEATRMMLTKWLMGETKGLQSTVVYEWKRILEVMKDLKRRNESVKASVLSWVEGNNAAAKHLCFTHWVSFRDQERIHLKHGKLRAELDELKNVHLEKMSAAQLQKQRGKIAVEMCLHKFLEGDRKGSLHGCFLLWEGYWEAMKKQRAHDRAITEAHSEHAYHLQKAKLEHDLKVAKEKEAKIAALEAMGLKSARAQFIHYFELWKIAYDQAKELRLEKEHKEHLLDKTMLTMGWADNDQLKHICLTEWHHLLPNKALLKAERANEHWKKLHSGPMRQMLFRLAAYDNAHLVKDVFYVYKEYIDQLRFHHALKQLNTSKKDQHRLEMERALMRMDSSLMSSCAFAEWKRLWIHYCHSRDFQKDTKALKSKHGDVMNKALAKWADDLPHLYLHAVLRALWQTVAEGREARGIGKELQLKRGWRRSALDYSCRYVDALERKLGVVALLYWKGVAEAGKSGRRADESNSELRKHLAVHCLATTQEAEVNLETSKKYSSLARLLQGEMQTQGITLEAMEHEVLLLEAQMLGSNLTRTVLTA